MTMTAADRDQWRGVVDKLTEAVDTVQALQRLAGDAELMVEEPEDSDTEANTRFWAYAEHFNEVTGPRATDMARTLDNVRMALQRARARVRRDILGEPS